MSFIRQIRQDWEHKAGQDRFFSRLSEDGFHRIGEGIDAARHAICDSDAVETTWL
jgi:hypothetical protein